MKNLKNVMSVIIFALMMLISANVCAQGTKSVSLEIPKEIKNEVESYVDDFKKEYLKLSSQSVAERKSSMPKKVNELIKYDLDYIANLSSFGADMKKIATSSSNYTDLHEKIVTYMNKNELSNQEKATLIKWDLSVKYAYSINLNSEPGSSLLRPCVTSVIAGAASGAYLGSWGGPWGAGIGGLIGAGIAIWENC
ncbi:MAG: hypothetical protein ACK5M1_08220 [Xanthomarina gelatinilytica]|uniref:hypothetical protein n=1 Tax=Xanthomarina gelatinilytica TaxID=1137281 RepID=UPI003A8B9932